LVKVVKNNKKLQKVFINKVIRTKMKYSKRLEFRLSEQEKQILKKLAEYHKTSVSSYIRKKALSK